MNIRDKIHPSKQPVGATHYNEDWHCSETEGIQYFKVGADAYHFWSGGRWVIGNTRMPARTITPLPNLQIETYATAADCNCGRRTPFAHKHAETCPCFHPQLIGRCERMTNSNLFNQLAWSHRPVPVGFPLTAELAAFEAHAMGTLGDDSCVPDFAKCYAGEQGFFDGRYAREEIRMCWMMWLERALNAWASADPADELGKVLDVLHAAGINSVSASEGVKLLVDKLVQTKVLLNSNYGIGRFVPDEPKPMCDHDWLYVESLSRMCCSKCEATRSST